MAGLEPANARIKTWCLSHLATSQFARLTLCSLNTSQSASKAAYYNQINFYCKAKNSKFLGFFTSSNSGFFFTELPAAVFHRPHKAGLANGLGKMLSGSGFTGVCKHSKHGGAGTRQTHPHGTSQGLINLIHGWVFL